MKNRKLLFVGISLGLICLILLPFGFKSDQNVHQSYVESPNNADLVHRFVNIGSCGSQLHMNVGASNTSGLTTWRVSCSYSFSDSLTVTQIDFTCVIKKGGATIVSTGITDANSPWYVGGISASPGDVLEITLGGQLWGESDACAVSTETFTHYSFDESTYSLELTEDGSSKDASTIIPGFEPFLFVFTFILLGFGTMLTYHYRFKKGTEI